MLADKMYRQTPQRPMAEEDRRGDIHCEVIAETLCEFAEADRVEAEVGEVLVEIELLARNLHQLTRMLLQVPGDALLEREAPHLDPPSFRRCADRGWRR